MAYTNKGLVQDYLATDVDDSLNTTLTGWITAVSNWIDRYCKKSFESVSSEKFYDGNGARSIFFDDASGAPTLVHILDVDGTVAFVLTEGAGNDYLVYPLNDTPKNELRLVSESTAPNFPNRNKSVAITAPFGFSTSVPKEIELVATKLVGEIMRQGLDGGKLSSVNLGELEISYQKINEVSEPLGIYQILDMYRDIEL